MILITGENGYLGKNFIKFFKYIQKNYTTLDEYLKNDNKYIITKIIHIAGVSDKEDFKNTKKTTESMINLSLRLIKLAEENNCEFVFFSSEAAENDLDIYGTYKRMIEFYIKSNLINYKILRIPRIYSNCREKGLIKLLKNNEVPEIDLNNEVEFLDLNLFLPQLFHIIFKETSNRVYYFKKLEIKTIREIKERYVN